MEKLVERSHVSTIKIRLEPIGDKAEIKRVTDYLKNGMEVQSTMMNQYISALYAAKKNNIPQEEWKQIAATYSRIPGSSKGSAYSTDILPKYPTGLPLAGSIPFNVNKKFNAACKKGLLHGTISLPTFRKDYPLYVHNYFVSIAGSKTGSSGKPVRTGITHTYASMEDFTTALYTKRTPEIILIFANNIKFQLVLGDIGKSIQLRKTLENCFNYKSTKYEICDSQIQLKKEKIFLLLSVKIPSMEIPLDENKVVGVSFGKDIPLICALNDENHTTLKVGDKANSSDYKTKLYERRKQLQMSVADCRGGHGRSRKLQRLERLHDTQRNFIKTYNHTLSKRVVDFALSNNAKYINLEDMTFLKNQDKDSLALGDWAYYELQSMIQYKAAANGIIVRKVLPAAPVCAICGHQLTDEEDEFFTCPNPTCAKHEDKRLLDLDTNAACAIADSKDFTKETLKLLPDHIKKEWSKSNPIVVAKRYITVTNDFRRADAVLLKNKVKYQNCIIFSNGIVKIMCEDDFYHEFDIKMDLKNAIDKEEYKIITDIIKNKNDANERLADTD